MRLNRFFDPWSRFWFTPGSPAPLCLFRILYGLLVLATAVFWTPDLFALFGPHGLVSIAGVQKWEHTPRFCFLFWMPPTDQSVFILWLVLLVFAVLATLGLFTRVSILVVYLCLLSFDHRAPMLMHSGDTLLRILSFIMFFSPAGAMFSLDSLIKAKREGIVKNQWEIEAPLWTVRLMQIQLAAVYCQATFAKLLGPMWREGTAVYYVSRLEQFARFPVPYLFDNRLACALLTWGTLIIQFALCSLIWYKPLRYYVLIAGCLLHIGIDWSMDIPLFEYLMMSLYLVFIDASDIRRVFEFFGRFKTTASGMFKRQVIRQDRV